MTWCCNGYTLMRLSMEVLISHVFSTSRWTSDPEVDAGCCSHLEFRALFPWARVSGIHLLLRSLAFTCLSCRSTLRSLWTVLRLRAHRFHGRHQRLALLPGLRVSGHCTRARARPHVQKRPLVLLRPRGDGSPEVTGAPRGSLRAKCVVLTVSLC